MNVFRKLNYLHVVLDDEQEYVTNNCTDELWNTINDNLDNKDFIVSLLFSEADDFTGDKVKDKVVTSKVLTQRGNSIYMLDVSELSIPEDFALKILEAEEEGNTEELTKYKNFWTLVSLNPDSRVRDNIFWFIRRWDIQIANSGLLIAYRNADIRKEAKYSTEQVKNIINAYYEEKYLRNGDPCDKTIFIGDNKLCLGHAYDEIVNGSASPIYTDHYSHTTTIELGKPVRLPRERCSSDNTVSCSTGLHAASKGWLKRNYFGGVGLQVLINPANITSIPIIDDYGKLRCCEYFPVAIVDFDSEGNVIEKPYNLHNDVAYLQQVRYSGEINNEDINHYELSSNYHNNEELYDSILARLKA